MLKNILAKSFLDNTVQEYLISLGIFIIGCVFLKIAKRIFAGRIKEFAKRTKTSFDDFLTELIETLVLPFGYLGVLFLSLKFLHFSDKINKGLNIFGMGVFTLFIVKSIVLFMNYGTSVYIRKSKRDESFKKSINGIMRILIFLVYTLAIAFFLDNLGFKISAVVAGLGIGGVAVALAAQAVLGDLFSYFAILFDRPFEIGDFIIVDDFMGVVENVGIKTTRINSLGGEQLIFSNTDLTNSRVRNYKRMKQRRVLFKLGVTYNTPLEKLKEIPGIIKDIINNVKDTKFDRAHFGAYGDFNLVIEIVYYVDGPDYNKYMDIQQEINFTIKKAFEDREIEFAFPTQTLYVNKTS